MALVGFIGVEDCTPARGANVFHVAVPLNCKIPNEISPLLSILATLLFWDSHLMIFRKKPGFCVPSSI